MANLIRQIDLSQIKDSTEFMRHASQVIADLTDAVNGQLSFGNLNTQTVQVNFQTANVDVQVQHNLNKTGVNYHVISKPTSLDVYHGNGTDSAKYIFLRSTVAATVTILLS